MTKSNITLRLERLDDYRSVEELTREAFWKNSRHICDEHLLVKRLREVSTFVPELDYVAEMDGRLVGHIIYTRSRIEDVSGITYETLTFGPLSVMPGYQNAGVGKALMLHTIDEARRLGYRAILIFGHPDYYPRVGFRRAAEFGITTADGRNFDPFMALPLYDGALDGIHGRYFIDPVYDNLDEKDVLEFEKGFPPKEKFVPVPISVLLCRLEPDAQRAIEGLKCPYFDEMRAKSEREISALSGIDKKSIDAIREVMLEHGYRWGEEEVK
jgi:predicted N-acetyltransferase YhbS